MTARAHGRRLRTLVNAARQLVVDRCYDLAAALTFYALLSSAPATLVLVSMLGVVGEAKSTTETVLGLTSQLSAEAANSLRPLVSELTSTPAAGATLVVSVLAAVWSASKYVGAFGRALNAINEVEEDRPYWKVKPRMLAITLVLLLLLALLGLLLVVSGPIAKSLGEAIGAGPIALLLWDIAKWPLIIVFIMLMIAILYYATPNLERVRFKWSSLGALIALIVIACVTAGFAAYINSFGSYNAAYGAIGGVIVGFVWLWMVNLSLLFGAEMDAEIERARQADRDTI